MRWSNYNDSFTERRQYEEAYRAARVRTDRQYRDRHPVSYAAGSKIVEGDVLKIEGEFYTVHDTAGHEVRLHVDKTTHLEGAFKAGDKVEAHVTDTGPCSIHCTP